MSIIEFDIQNSRSAPLLAPIMLNLLLLYRLIALQSNLVSRQTGLSYYVSIPLPKKSHQIAQVALTLIALNAQISIG